MQRSVVAAAPASPCTRGLADQHSPIYMQGQTALGCRGQGLQPLVLLSSISVPIHSGICC